jgi:hypothetical protein
MTGALCGRPTTAGPPCRMAVTPAGAACDWHRPGGKQARRGKLARRRAFHLRIMAWAKAMLAASEAMSEAEHAEFDEWAAEHVDGSGRFGMGDWPGWATRIVGVRNPWAGEVAG